MEPKDLIKVWDAPDNTKLTPKQISLRLPLLVSAKISALCDMYSRKTKTEIIGDLLATALDQFESGLEDEKGQCYGPESDGPDSIYYVYENIGSRGRFWTLTGKYLRDLEQEAGITEPMKIPSAVICEYPDSEEIS
jgi:hypothetical protein